MAGPVTLYAHGRYRPTSDLLRLLHYVNLLYYWECNPSWIDENAPDGERIRIDPDSFAAVRNHIDVHISDLLGALVTETALSTESDRLDTFGEGYNAMIRQAIIAVEDRFRVHPTTNQARANAAAIRQEHRERARIGG